MLLAAAELQLSKPILFVESRFLWIFAIIFAVHWTLRSNIARKVWLLIASHSFYACFFIGNPVVFFQDVFAGAWDRLPVGWWFPLLLILSTVMDYWVGIGIENSLSERRRRVWVATSICVNLGVLGFFKYYNFFEDNVRMVFGWFGFEPIWSPLRIFLPYGISFYTFQSLSYSIEVYRRKLPAERSFLNLAVFIAFFPQVVAGPIVRAMAFLPQTRVKQAWSAVDVRGCLTLFFVGFVKKACVSDTLSMFVDPYFAAPQEFTVISAWAAVISYAVQIYCDFSGYSDMAVAVARLLGYELTQNFAFPYFSANIADFWRRWHMSLSSWLRDYLYVSIGGNRGSKLFTYRNLMITMLLGGLWHGASWTFVLWGGLHGAALIAHREWRRVADPRPRLQLIMRWIAIPLTFYWVLLAWVPFRAGDVYADAKSGEKLRLVGGGFKDLEGKNYLYSPGQLERDSVSKDWFARSGAEKGKPVVKRLNGSLASSGVILKALVLQHADGERDVAGYGIFAVFALLAFMHWLNWRGVLSAQVKRLPDWAFAGLLGFGWAFALLMKPMTYSPFIYFQF